MTPYFKALVLQEQSLKFFFFFWLNKNHTFGSHYCALKSKHVIGCHFGLGHRKKFQAYYNDLSTYDFKNDVSQDRGKLIVLVLPLQTLFGESSN